MSLKFEKQRAKKKKKTNPDEGAEIPEESKVSKRLSERTNQNVIMLVLILVFALFLLDIGFWNETYITFNYECETMIADYYLMLGKG